jgi:HlyD family secretion protein
MPDLDTIGTSETVDATGGPARARLSGAPLPAADDPARRRARERRRRFARRLRRGLLALAVAAASAGAVLALRPRPAPVDVGRTGRGPLEVVVEESGKTRVKDRYFVSAPAAGSLSRLIIEPGDTVNEGDVIAEIAPADSPLLDPRARAEAEARVGAALSAVGQAQAQAARATAARSLSEHELERTARMARAGSVSRQAYEQAEFEARMRAEEYNSALFAGKVAAQEARAARAALAGGRGSNRDRHLDVRAPASGRVLRVFQKSAGVVAAGAPLIEVGDPAHLEVVVDLLTTVAVQVHPGTPVTVHDWGGDQPLHGRVRLIEPSGFTKPSALGVDEQRVNLVVALTDPRERWAALGDGFRVETRLVLWRAEDVLKVPQGAVFRHGDGWAVYRIDGGRAALVPVRIGHRGETEVEVLAGLGPGQAVAVHPGDRVQAGARVDPR